MCNPGALSIATQAAGAVNSAAGSIFSAKSQKLGLNLDAYFANMNADAATENARRVTDAGVTAEQNQKLQTAQIKSSQRAAMAANGVDLSTGGALDRQVSTDLMGEIDANTIRLNAAREAAGYQTQASNYRSEALTRTAAAKGISPFLSGVTSLIDSAGKISSDWYSLSKAGAFTKKKKAGGSDSSLVDPEKYGYGPGPRNPWALY